MRSFQINCLDHPCGSVAKPRSEAKAAEEKETVRRRRRKRQYHVPAGRRFPPRMEVLATRDPKDGSCALSPVLEKKDFVVLLVWPRAAALFGGGTFAYFKKDTVDDESAFKKKVSHAKPPACNNKFIIDEVCDEDAARHDSKKLDMVT